MVFWPSGHPDFWPSSLLAIRPSDHLTIWSSDLLVIWLSGHPDFWPSDHQVIQPYGHPTIWLSGHLDFWPSDHPTIWLSGHLTIWSSDHPTIWPSVPMPQKCPYWDIFGLSYCRLHQSQIPNVLPSQGCYKFWHGKSKFNGFTIIGIWRCHWWTRIE